MLLLDQVSFSYHQAPFLREVSVSARPGVVTGLVGPNGCGKSTLLRLAAGLLPPTGGRVLVNGADLARQNRRKAACQIALLRQSNPPLAQQAIDIVLSGRYPHRRAGLSYTAQDKAAACRAMRLAGCLSLEKEQMNRLSGGERQRVFLAAALAQDTPVLLLDEPTTYLDVSACLELLDLLACLARQEGKAVLLVLHDLPLALRCCDQIAVLQQGRLQAFGCPGELLKSGVLEQVFQATVLQFQKGGAPFYCIGGPVKK